MGPLHQIRHTSQVSVSAHVSSNAQKVHWHEDAINTSKSEPKMDFADGFVHKLAEHFRKPEISGRENSENGRNSHDQVEVRYDEICIMQRQVNRRLCQEQSRKSASHEERYEAKREHHRRRKMNLSAPQCTEPIKSFDCGWNADGHRHDGKGKSRIRAHAADEHVVAPNAEASESDSAHRVHHRAIAEYR